MEVKLTKMPPASLMTNTENDTAARKELGRKKRIELRPENIQAEKDFRSEKTVQTVEPGSSKNAVNVPAVVPTPTVETPRLVTTAGEKKHDVVAAKPLRFPIELGDKYSDPNRTSERKLSTCSGSSRRKDVEQMLWRLEERKRWIDLEGNEELALEESAAGAIDHYRNYVMANNVPDVDEFRNDHHLNRFAAGDDIARYL
jgi:hypothetical protein